MEIIPLTIFVGLILVAAALVFFLYLRSVRPTQSLDHDALLPLEEERLVPANKNKSVPAALKK